MNNQKKYTPLEAQKKAEGYCAYQERCHREVRSKLLEWEIYGDNLENIINHLIQENFLNEERFAKSFARGKFRIKKWGKIKIRLELKKRNISDYCIKIAFNEIDEDEYIDTLISLIEKNAALLNSPTATNKLVQTLLRKGFEYDLISEVIKQQRLLN